MTPSLPSRGVLLALLALAVIILIPLTDSGGTIESFMYVGYGIAIPFMFLLVILGGVYFGARHLLSS